MKIKKVLAMLLVVAVAGSILAGCSLNPRETGKAKEGTWAESNKKTAGETEAEIDTSDGEFNPDNENGVSIAEIRSEFGAVPVESGKIFGVVAKAFQNEFWRIFKEGYEAGVKCISDQGLDITVDVQAPTNETDEMGQLAIVNNMINEGYDALLLSPISDANLTPAVETAAENNIPVTNVNDGLIASAPYFVGPRAYENGELAAEWVSNKLGGEGEVAIVIGMPKSFAAPQRTAGFEDWCAANAPGINIVATQNADWDRNKAKELANTWIQQHPNLKAIFCNNDTMALGVVEAVDEAGVDILVVGVDGIGEAYDSIRAGRLDATIDSFPYYMSQIALECSLRTLAGQKLPRVVWTPQALIDSENVDTPAAEIIGWEDAEYIGK